MFEFITGGALVQVLKTENLLLTSAQELLYYDFCTFQGKTTFFYFFLAIAYYASFICIFCSTWCKHILRTIFIALYNICFYFEETLTLFIRIRTLCPLHLINVFLSLDILSLQACPAPKIPRIPRQGGSRWQEEGVHLPLGNCLLMSVICHSGMNWDAFTFLSSTIAKHCE